MTEPTVSSNFCPKCGAALPSAATAGLCPRCLLAEAMLPTQPDAGPAAARKTLAPEELAPHFPQLEILECLGRGGMGVVYKARQKSLNRFVALKLLAPERVREAKFAERFAREARALAALNHPNIVTIYDFGQAGGFYFLLMEFVDGVNLRQLLRARKFTPEEALAIVPPLCDALQFAHDRGIVHRDIKPENLLLDKTGRVKVADFGIAKMIEPEAGGADLPVSPEIGAAPQDGPTGVVGTPNYTAPEQKTDPGRVDSRADIYSLGVVFYEMLTGELPGKRLEPPSRKVHIDVRLDEIVLRALEENPALRYQQVSEVKTMVETIVSSGSNAAPPKDEVPKRRSKFSWVGSLPDVPKLDGPFVVRQGNRRVFKWSVIGASFLTGLCLVCVFAPILFKGLDFKESKANFLENLLLGLFAVIFTARLLWGIFLPVQSLPAEPVVSLGSSSGKSAPASSIKRKSGWRRLLLWLIPLVLLILVVWSAAFRKPSNHGYSYGNEKAVLAAPHPEPHTVRELTGPPFVARLPEGGSIELLAVRLRASTNQPWWQPDGTPSAYGSSIEAWATDHSGSGVMALARLNYPKYFEKWPRQTGETNRDAMRIGDGLCSALKDGQMMDMIESNDAPERMFGVMIFDQALFAGNQTTLPVKVATGQWATLITVPKRGGLASLFASDARKEWSFSEDAVGTLKVTVAHLITRLDVDAEYRFVAVDTDGKEHLPATTETTRNGNDLYSKYEVTFNDVGGDTVLLKNLREVRLELRTFQQVEFRNVSLQPGHITKVQVKDFGGATNTNSAAAPASPGLPSAMPVPPAIDERAAALQFRLVAPEGTTEPVDLLPNAVARNGPPQFRVLRNVRLDGSAVAMAGIKFDEDGQRSIWMQFTEAGAKRFGEITASNVGHQIVIVYHDKVLSGTRIAMTIPGGRMSVSSNLGEKEVHSIVDCLNRAPTPTEEAWAFTAMRDRPWVLLASPGGPGALRVPALDVPAPPTPAIQDLPDSMRSYLDLDTGNMVTNDSVNWKTREGHDWISSNGLDLAAAVSSLRSGIMTGFDMVIEPLPPNAWGTPANDWDTITAADVVQSWALMQTVPKQTVIFGVAPVNLFLFQTREGGRGILRIGGFGTEVSKDKGFVILSYKLVEPAGATNVVLPKNSGSQQALDKN